LDPIIVIFTQHTCQDPVNVTACVNGRDSYNSQNYNELKTGSLMNLFVHKKTRSERNKLWYL